MKWKLGGNSRNREEGRERERRKNKKPISQIFCQLQASFRTFFSAFSKFPCRFNDLYGMHYSKRGHSKTLATCLLLRRIISHASSFRLLTSKRFGWFVGSLEFTGILYIYVFCFPRASSLKAHNLEILRFDASTYCVSASAIPVIYASPRDYLQTRTFSFCENKSFIQSVTLITFNLNIEN